MNYHLWGKVMWRQFFLSGILLVISSSVLFAQKPQKKKGPNDFDKTTAIGFRFATDINSIYQPGNLPLIKGYYSNIVVGPFLKQYFSNGVTELGLNFCYKGHKGSFNFPLVSQNFNDDESTAITGYEVDFKVGPRILRIFYPKFGIIAGYRTKQEGLLLPNKADEPISRFYAALPLGFTIDLPTSFGTTGIGFFYDIGLTNLMTNPKMVDSGGKIRSFNFEIHVALRVAGDD